MSVSWHYEAGFEAGVRGFRGHGRHEVPREHPPGSTPEGRDWMLGCCAGLQQCIYFARCVA